MAKWYDKGDDGYDDRKRDKNRPKDEYRRKGKAKRADRFDSLMKPDDDVSDRGNRRRYGDDE